MDVLLFSLLLLAFILIYKGKKLPALATFTTTMFLYIYWFSYHATDKININL